MIYKGLAFGISVMLLASCDNASRKPLDVDALVDAIPVQTDPDGRWGMMDINGQLMFENEFVDCPSVALKGVFSVVENDAVSVYAVGDQPHLLGDCENLLQAGCFNDGLMPIARAEAIYVVDSKGAKAFDLTLIDGKAIIGASAIFSDRRLVVSNSEGLYGCVDTEGATVIQPKYLLIRDFSSGYAIATLTDGTDAIIDVDGAQVCVLKKGIKAVSGKVDHGYVVVSDSTGHLAFADLEGRLTRLPDKVHAVGEYTDEYFTFRDANDLWGVINRDDDMSMMMRPKFRAITLLGETGNFLVNLDGTWSVINKKGKKEIAFPASYKEVVATRFGSQIKYFAQDIAGWVLLDNKGEEIQLPYNVYGLGCATPTKWLSIDAPSASVDITASVVDEVVAQVSPNSLCGIQLNAIGNRWYRNQVPDSLVDAKEFVPDSIPPFKGLGDVRVLGVTDRMISVAMRVNSQTGKIEYAFMPSNTVAAIELDIPVKSQEIFTKSKAELIQKLQGQGFRLVDDTEDIVLLRSAYANLEVSYDDDEKTITVLMYRL